MFGLLQAANVSSLDEFLYCIYCKLSVPGVMKVLNCASRHHVYKGMFTQQLSQAQAAGLCLKLCLMNKNLTSLTFFVEKGGNPIKVCKVYRKKGRNLPMLLTSGLLWNFANKSNAVNTIAFVCGNCKLCQCN